MRVGRAGPGAPTVKTSCSRSQLATHRRASTRRPDCGSGQPRCGGGPCRARDRRHRSRSCWSAACPARSCATRCPRSSRTRSSPGCCAGSGSSRRRAIRSGRCSRCATSGPTRSSGDASRQDLDPGIAREGVATVAAAVRATRTRRCCWRRTCTPATSWRPSASHGWSSTPSPTSATPTTTHCSTCSTARSGWRPTRSGLAHRDGRPAELDADRFLQWLFARAVVEHEWWPDGEMASRRALAPLTPRTRVPAARGRHAAAPPHRGAHGRVPQAADGERPEAAGRRLDGVGPDRGEALLEQGGEDNGVIGDVTGGRQGVRRRGRDGFGAAARGSAPRARRAGPGGGHSRQRPACGRRRTAARPRRHSHRSRRARRPAPTAAPASTYARLMAQPTLRAGAPPAQRARPRRQRSTRAAGRAPAPARPACPRRRAAAARSAPASARECVGGRGCDRRTARALGDGDPVGDPLADPDGVDGRRGQQRGERGHVGRRARRPAGPSAVPVLRVRGDRGGVGGRERADLVGDPTGQPLVGGEPGHPDAWVSRCRRRPGAARRRRERCAGTVRRPGRRSWVAILPRRGDAGLGR